MRFFDTYSRFYETSGTGAQPNRLNARYRALIERNVDVIRNRRVLDLASHDGRWSFAALIAGAEHIVGIEGRESLVARARETTLAYRIDANRFEFICGDVHERIRDFAPGTFDTVFCFGFLYHTLEPMSLLEAIGRLRPSCLIVDTAVVKSAEPLIALRAAETQREGDAIRRENSGPGPVLVGTPSLPAVELMLTSAGFAFTILDWAADMYDDWNFLEDYRDGRRVIIRATPTI